MPVGVAVFVFLTGLAAQSPAAENTAARSAPSVAVTASLDTTVQWVDLSAGIVAYGHTCGVSRAGPVFCWGGNDSGQLGIGDTEVAGTSRPVPVATGFEARQVTAGSAHTCALTADGTAYCWGNNRSGELGTGNTRDSPVPQMVADSLTFADIGAGQSHTCALTDNGDVLCWGNPAGGVIGDGNVALTLAGKTPTPQWVQLEEEHTFTDLSVGMSHNCALTEEGVAYCWGGGSDGKLGTGTTDNAHAPTPMKTDLRFRQISAGANHTCGLTEENALYCWGSNVEGQLGGSELKVGHQPNENPSMNGPPHTYPMPQKVADAGRFTQVTAASYHTCALTDEGRAFCWGANHRGQVGDGNQTSVQMGNGPETREPTPTPVAGDHVFEALVLGNQYSCGRTPEGDAYCWGGNAGGRLGTTGRHRPRPAAVQTPDTSFASENRSPLATIIEPESGSHGQLPAATIAPGDSLLLRGLAADYEDGLLHGDAVVWSSSELGRLGTGTELEISIDTEALHTIQLTVTDPDGATARDSIQVAVEPDDSSSGGS